MVDETRRVVEYSLTQYGQRQIHTACIRGVHCLQGNEGSNQPPKINTALRDGSAGDATQDERVIVPFEVIDEVSRKKTGQHRDS